MLPLFLDKYVSNLHQFREIGFVWGGMRIFGIGVSPGNVAVCHGSVMKEVDRKVRLAELIMRWLIFALALLASFLLATASEVKVIFSVHKEAKFTDMTSLVFLVISNGVVAAYSLLQGLRCVLCMVRGIVMFSKPSAWVIFSGDQVMAYVTLAAVAAAAQSAVFAEFGQSELQWMKLSDIYRKYCIQVGEGIASALLVSLGMIGVSCLSAFSLFRLYNKASNKNSSSTWYKDAVSVVNLLPAPY